MKSHHFLFGYNKPKYTVHFLQRYAERFYNVKKENALGWINFHKKQFEITHRLYNSELYNETNNKEVREKYGNDIKFLKWKKIIFVVVDNLTIVTCYKHLTNN